MIVYIYSLPTEICCLLLQTGGGLTPKVSIQYPSLILPQIRSWDIQTASHQPSHTVPVTQSIQVSQEKMSYSCHSHNGLLKQECEMGTDPDTQNTFLEFKTLYISVYTYKVSSSLYTVRVILILVRSVKDRPKTTFGGFNLSN